MVSSPKTFDASKSGKMTELTQTKYRFGILVGFTHNIACQTGFENSTGNTNHNRCFKNIQLLQINIVSELFPEIKIHPVAIRDGVALS